MVWSDIERNRRRLRRERGAIVKDWGGRLPVALIYPNSYYLGMSSLGFQTVYGFFNGFDTVVCERVFVEEASGEVGAPLSVESQRPLGDFAILAFSISFELDYFNVVRLLNAAGIPLFAEQRDERHPLIIAGGPCLTANPEPVAPFLDAIAIGEGEAVLPALTSLLMDGAGEDRRALLKALSLLPGVYVPALKQAGPVQRQWARNLDDFATTSAVLTPDTDLANMFLVEVARGCGRGCRFCLAGFAFRPFRYRSLGKLLEQAKPAQGARVGLVGAAVADHPQIDELVAALRSAGTRISVSSLRADAVTEAMIQALAESGTRTVVLAPEAGAERLRCAINKVISEESLLRAADIVAKHRLSQLKLYYMLGLPTETEQDIRELVRLTLAVSETVARWGNRTRVSVNVSPFVPKAGTPFQWLPMEQPAELERRLSAITSALRPKGIKVSGESVAWSVVQGVLARGDRKLSRALVRAKNPSLAAWRRALEEENIKQEAYLYRAIPFTEPLPWVAVESGVEAGYLRREAERAVGGRASPACPPTGCHLCGVC
ncbi:MAG: radical SAM protein [Chloroflexi bacterium]|nr:radical SAM protein [Chloroflexota bacterium]